MILVCSMLQGLGGENLGGFQGWQQRREKSGHGADRYGLARQAPIQLDCRGTAGYVQGIDGSGNELERQPGEQTAQADPDDCPRRSEQQRLRQKKAEHLRRGRSQRAQRADLGSPADHRNGNRVVDQECSYDQRHVAERRQVPAESAEHLVSLFGSLLRPFHAQSRRQLSLEQGLVCGQLFRRDDQIHAVQFPQAMEGELCGGNVHDGNVACQHFPRPLGSQNSTHREFVLPVVDEQSEF